MRRCQKEDEWRATVPPLALYCQRVSSQYPAVLYEKGIDSIERCARHCGTRAFDGAEGTVPGADPGEPEDAGHHDHGGGFRLPQPAHRKRVSGVAQGLARNEYPDRRDVVRGVAVPAEVPLGALRGQVPATFPGASQGMDTADADCPCGGDSTIRATESC